jgi:GTPase
MMNNSGSEFTGDHPGHRSGFIALVGRPNVGKSTLLNCMVGNVVSITTSTPQTTRNRVRGIVSLENCQMVFLDTPGLHFPANRKAINRFMHSEAKAALAEVDLVVMVVESRKKEDLPDGHPEDRLVMEAVKDSGRLALLAINKIDLLGQKETLLPQLSAYATDGLFEELIPISAISGEGVEILLSAIAKRLPVGPRYFPDDIITDQPERLLAAEFIREQVIRHTGQEIPHAVAVVIDAFEEHPERDLAVIHATIYVERSSQKGILIGAGGKKLKSIGSRSRASIERLLACRVFLDLRVKHLTNWSRTSSGLRSMGYLGEPES